MNKNRQVNAELLLREAKAAQANSYSPYSKFPVGAALLCADGTTVQGCNIENTSYGLTNCAERVAIQTAIASGRREFIAMAIVGVPEEPCMPCGACRQVMVEFNIPRLYFEGPKGKIISYELDEILPLSFGPRDLI
ncbi:cytidine deaminase [uncultured Veillonella sp.]|uniref:cytidine deaminase n=1 Tax=uncultured Veillonella sp. TaxID=159268 RepID=UPI0025FA703D|nr:cytidine deaminase [uncultured Veillonella sp.]